MRAAPEAGGEHGQVAEEEAGVGRGQLPGADLLLLHPNCPVLPHLGREQQIKSVQNKERSSKLPVGAL